MSVGFESFPIDESGGPRVLSCIETTLFEIIRHGDPGVERTLIDIPASYGLPIVNRRRACCNSGVVHHAIASSPGHRNETKCIQSKILTGRPPLAERTNGRQQVIVDRARPRRLDPRNSLCIEIRRNFYSNGVGVHSEARRRRRRVVPCKSSSEVVVVMAHGQCKSIGQSTGLRRYDRDGTRLEVASKRLHDLPWLVSQAHDWLRGSDVEAVLGGEFTVARHSRSYQPYKSIERQLCGHEKKITLKVDADMPSSPTLCLHPAHFPRKQDPVAPHVECPAGQAMSVCTGASGVGGDWVELGDSAAATVSLAPISFGPTVA
ncbi:hypothetical protein DFP72DRAFT_1060615 [Ephemerocybe angulata]|uniref:Uncharacterized protein n=1 Tax=Ephemerocybe angulata TaxID=980116 RepID=A0A8H6IDB8_9AGAR|nr:hypothetical protein DFP72DRAFT_1060615 [Tulosesus angulatus]